MSNIDQALTSRRKNEYVVQLQSKEHDSLRYNEQIWKLGDQLALLM